MATTVCVEIAVHDDPRLLAAVASLAAQSRRPDRILLAASPDTPAGLVEGARRAAPDLPLDVVRAPGGVVAARAAAQGAISEEITAFLDSDEVAPPGWLDRLVGPIEAKLAEFTGGPTRPLRAPTRAVERYSVLLERSIYDRLDPSRPSTLPLQNSAWTSDLVRRLGFDPRIPFAEDHDLECRALAGGARGTFVPAAWVFHDPTAVGGWGDWARKRYRYQVAMTMSLLKNRGLADRMRARGGPVRHPLAVVDLGLKPFAFVAGTVRWRRLERTPTGVPAPG